ncbi:hypothetical protein ENUP19_0139G0007 [Entamoeba nuttalli]|uniref:Pre-mRNA-splicing factor cwc2, putative n=2 Tax=Entamoeba nuttalli TaxID=412467 RepID=K2H2P6_ENTNP|nr:pre-mRNA-splicing factor cwc2, putative [Entamoeba nuttalli P19]EKE41788.1 pre-mRNA-splicing factor cwc2, putative [Entamoeba nuttalli P19]|eukprot:XP_008855875.1 pre-mRNA-splicing factor cwc2, putative [Entamoeba nuttalli P19]
MEDNQTQENEIKDEKEYSYKPITSRPARKQSDGYVPYTPTRSGDYNIWYNRYSGFESKQTRGDRGNMTRCCIKTDAGTTKSKEESPICLHFALGKCFKGKECLYKHQLPQEEEEKHLGVIKDIFGRERHLTERDDMGGIGRFSKENRTLYVSGFKGNLPPQQIEEILRRHFGEWGELEYIRVLPIRNIAFIRYKLRGSAEFAKVAMADQSLDSNERLNIRWAYDDPNPIAKAIEEQSIASQYVQQIKDIMKERKEQKQEYLNSIEPPMKKQAVVYEENPIGFKYSIKENKTLKDKEHQNIIEVAKEIEKKKEKYVPNKYTGFMHPYSYGLFYPKQFENAKVIEQEEDDDENEK